MNILITGNRGFLGSHLHKYLKGKGHTVIGVDNLSHACEQIVPSNYCDIRYYNELLPYFCNCDIVFHLAAQISVDKSIFNSEETIATNVLGTQNILELARKFKTKVIFASSSEVYGSAQADKISEEHPLDAQSPYGASKIAGDRLCWAYHQTYNMDISIVRCFNIFGEYQGDDSYGGVIAKFVKAALNNQTLQIYGDGSQERDYMHIKDALQAYELAMEHEFHDPVNFGTGKTVRILELARRIQEMIKSDSRVKCIVPRRGEVQRLCADISLAEKFLDFEPQTNFWEDLEKYIEWVKKRMRE